jgi:replicative DNA helicase
MKTKYYIQKELERIINNPDINEYDIVDNLRGLIYSFDINQLESKATKSVSELYSENIKSLESGNEYFSAIKTGFTDLDRSIGGFTQGELVVIGGRPAMGKTQLLVNLTLSISKSVPIMYFSFDLSESMLTSRFISCLSDIPVCNILQNRLSPEEKSKLISLGGEFSARKIFINDGNNSSLTSFRAHCLKVKQHNDVKIIFVDYLQLMSIPKSRQNRESDIAHICRELKNIAKECEVCVIATSQLSRAVETRGGDKKPQLSDLRESGAIEQDADKVIFIHRPEYYGLTQDSEGNPTEGVMELIIAKNRNGPTGSCKLLVDRSFTIIKDGPSFNYSQDFNFSDDRLNEINKSPN